MTAKERWLSLAIAFHMAAVVVGAIPNLDDFGFELDRRDPPPFERLTAILDAAAPKLVWLHRVVWSSTAPVRPVARKYLRATAMFETWNMFCNPARQSQYARIGYRLRLADGSSRVEYEAVFPTGPQGVWKLVSAYFDSFSDKAFTGTADAHRRAVDRSALMNRPIPNSQTTGVVIPFMRYYGRRRLEAGLPPGARLTAVEFWWGTRPIPPPPTGPLVTPVSSASGDEVRWGLWAVDELK